MLTVTPRGQLGQSDSFLKCTKAALLIREKLASHHTHTQRGERGGFSLAPLTPLDFLGSTLDRPIARLRTGPFQRPTKGYHQQLRSTGIQDRFDAGSWRAAERWSKNGATQAFAKLGNTPSIADRVRSWPLTMYLLAALVTNISIPYARVRFLLKVGRGRPHRLVVRTPCCGRGNPLFVPSITYVSRYAHNIMTFFAHALVSHPALHGITDIKLHTESSC